MDCGYFTDITMKGGLCIIYTSLLTISVLSRYVKLIFACDTYCYECYRSFNISYVLYSCALFILVVSEALHGDEGVNTNVDLSGLHNVSQKVAVGEQDVPGPQDSPETQLAENQKTNEDHEMIFAETLSLNSVTTDG